MLKYLSVLFTLLLLSYSASAKRYYSAQCNIKIQSDKHPDIILIEVIDNTINIQVNTHWQWCQFIDQYDDLLFYECDKYKLTFKNRYQDMTFGGSNYFCEFDNE